MRENWIVQQPIQSFLAGCAVVSGFVLAGLSIRQNSFVVTTGLIAIGLAALVGAGKHASP